MSNRPDTTPQAPSSAAPEPREPEPPARPAAAPTLFSDALSSDAPAASPASSPPASRHHNRLPADTPAIAGPLPNRARVELKLADELSDESIDALAAPVDFLARPSRPLPGAAEGGAASAAPPVERNESAVRTAVASRHAEALENQAAHAGTLYEDALDEDTMGEYALHEDAWRANVQRSVPQSSLQEILSRESHRRESRRRRARRVLRRRARLRAQQRWPWLGSWLWAMWPGPKRWHWPEPVEAWVRARQRSRSLLDNSLTAPNIFSARLAGGTQRGPAYRAELLDLFRQRLRLVAALTMVALPLFALLHLTLTPQAGRTVLLVYAALFALCAQTRAMARRATSLSSIRLLSLAAYALFCAGSAIIVVKMGASHVFILGGHNHIVLSVLLLPYTVWECAAVGAIAIVSLAWAGWVALVPGQSALYFSHLFVLGTTTLFVLCIAHFQSVLHRRAFDAAFDLVRSATRLQALSFLDPLTGGFNRRYLEKMLGIEIARAARFARPLSVVMFDLDNFKMVNDVRGHAAGDAVLREVWQATLGAVREVDTAARYGGDEFAIVLPESDEAAARVIAERLQSAARSHLHHRFGAASREGQVTLSIGIITTRLHEPVPAQTLIERADERLYAAKRNGKNGIAD